MLIAVDVGNTTTNFGVFERGRLRRRFAVATTPALATGDLAARLRRAAAAGRVRLQEASQIILCSVVPAMSAPLIRSLRRLSPGRIRVVGRDLRVPLTNRYRYPSQVGQDRLVGAYAAWRIYRRDCIVADFGTAITIDVVTRRGEYLGGAIAPGLEVSLEALANRTAMLPLVRFQDARDVLGRDTVSSIRSGLIYGSAALCDGLVKRLRARYVPRAIVVATGGAARIVARHTETIQHVRPSLMLEGLHLLSINMKLSEIQSKS